MQITHTHRKAAVIVLLDTSNNCLILTRRCSHLPYHAGEICFPGGCYQSSDRSLLSTGLRELEEELGIEKSRVDSLAPLSSEMTLTGFCIYPWFGSISRIKPYRIETREVEEILFIELDKVLLKDNYQTLQVPYKGYTIKTIQFMYKDYNIWGATARILRKLCALKFPL